MRLKPIQLPLDVHPKVAKTAQAVPGLEALDAATSAINDALLKVTDPRSLAKALADRTADALRRANKALTSTEAAGSFQAKSAADALLKRGEFEKEIRDTVRASKNPADTVRKMVRDGDADSVAAVLRAPPLLSGLDVETHASIYEFAKATFQPERHKQELDAANRARRLRRAIELFTAETTRINKAIAGSDEALAAALAPKPKDAA